MSMTTWREIATGRGFTDLGNRTWTAPNGQTVAEGFVEAFCQPERMETERRYFDPSLPAPTTAQTSVTESSLDRDATCRHDAAQRHAPPTWGEPDRAHRNVDYGRCE